MADDCDCAGCAADDDGGCHYPQGVTGHAPMPDEPTEPDEPVS